MHTFRLLTVVGALALVVGACGEDDPADTPEVGAEETDGTPADPGDTVTLLTHDSFDVSEDVLAAFTQRTGIEVEIVPLGDAGTALNQSILTADAPQGDVLFGVDTSFLSRALDADLFLAYESPGLADVDPRFMLDPEHRATPITYGDVCLNYDVAHFADTGLDVPQDLSDLADPAYAGLLAVWPPSTGSVRTATSTSGRTWSPTTSSSPTAGPRRTTTNSAALVAATARWWCPTPRARRPRSCSPTPSPTSRPPV